MVSYAGHASVGGINARFMESMMGVKERFDIPESFVFQKGKSLVEHYKDGGVDVHSVHNTSIKAHSVYAIGEKTISSYKEINFREKDAQELMHLYLRFESPLLKEWKAP
ncbi:MAG: hypothetical protein IPP46_20665 [Bacteroidetes bacterium]|nr:hypothetical protein [Bacteroidota bacterium]